MQPFRSNFRGIRRQTPPPPLSHFLCQSSCGAGSRSWQGRLTLTRRGGCWLLSVLSNVQHMVEVLLGIWSTEVLWGTLGYFLVLWAVCHWQDGGLLNVDFAVQFMVGWIWFANQTKVHLHLDQSQSRQLHNHILGDLTLMVVSGGAECHKLAITLLDDPHLFHSKTCFSTGGVQNTND